MAGITYTNRKGATYYLCQGHTRSGTIRYYFARAPREEPVQTIPDGYVIAESVNGVVSLTRDRPSPIRPEELAVVEQAVRRHPTGRHYRVEARGRYIVIYESSVANLRLEHNDDLLRMLPPGRGREDLEASLAPTAQHSPVMRFQLVDAGARTFHAERWCYRGSIDDWIGVGTGGPLADLAAALIPALGTDRFFELW